MEAKMQKEDNKKKLSKPDIKIFVSHRIDLDSEIIDNPLYVPVRCGAVYDKRKNITMLGDNTGDNVSDRRGSLCELTVQYWAWKNANADYYGLCHYRRFLSFSDKSHKSDGWQINEISLNQTTIEKYELNNPIKMQKHIEQFDAVLISPVDIRLKETPKGICKTVESHWLSLENILIEGDIFDKLLKIIQEKYPEYYGYSLKYLKNKMYRGYNCFILKKQLFNELCSFEFSVLFELEKLLDTTHYGQNMNRTLGFMGEILSGIYFFMIEKEGKHKISNRQLVYFKNTDKRHSISNIKSIFNKNNIACVLIANEFMVPCLSVFLQSIIEQSSNCNNYDIIILENGISKENKEILKGMIRGYDNMSIRFVCPNQYIYCIKSFKEVENLPIESYYRILIPWILSDYEKAIVLHSDMIAKTDIAKLNDIDIKNYLLAGVRDISFSGVLNHTPSIREYCEKELKLNEPYDYINTGVLVMNLAELRKCYNPDEVVELIESNKFKIVEQDTINALFGNKVKFIDMKWNYCTAANEGVKFNIQLSPYKLYEEYEKIKEPYIIHFSNLPKPWMNSEVERSLDFWRLARNTPYYELILSRNASYTLNEHFGNLPYKKFDNRSGARKIADAIFPTGTNRRRVMKKILPKGSLGWNILKKIYVVISPKYKSAKI
ncbi:hypothetical protein CCS79_14615 [Clostridium diolis]|uniref:DUF4422 domain-containing protein n=1 Tax=Clostridium diolis TaxID=223919 RepID=UPI000B406BB9|nr:DUF4422 domain-containing protein [Clostridium diolis]OVE67350.1 hypothetical protein CCS79_14615 [Clostridium diolis]